MIEANVSKEGILSMRVPERYRGKRVQVSIRDAEKPVSLQWSALTRILDQLDQLDLPRRSHQQILDDLRADRDA
ncbi:MAG TPA: hypothetical protein DCS21_10110 [Gammaproteobacteria bacterium]|nr:hypothetical protein [Gammaproteobacteria bacterium]